MEDTNFEIRAIQQRLWMELPEEERFRRCGEMFTLAKVFAWQRAPIELSPEDKRRFVFREMYGFELPDRRDENDGIDRNKWLNIIYSGFWDYPFAFVVRYKNATYLFHRGDFDDEVDDYPSEYRIFLSNDIDIEKIESNFRIRDGGDLVGTIDMREIEFDPTHREQIYSRLFRKILNEH